MTQTLNSKQIHLILANSQLKVGAIYRKTDIDTAECSNALLRSDAMLDPLQTSSPVPPPIPHWEGEGGDMVGPSAGELELAHVDPRLVAVFKDPENKVFFFIM